MYGPGNPLIVTPERVGAPSKDALRAWIRAERDALLDTRRRRGAVLLRGFTVASPDDFQDLVTDFDVPLMPYDEGMSRRPELRSRIFPTTAYPPAEDIGMHNELCHAAKPPRALFLFCVTPPRTGGQTPLIDTRYILQRADPAVMERIRGRRITYVTNLPDAARGLRLGRSWQETYGTDRRDVIEALLESRGTRWAWQDTGGLRTWRAGNATTPHPVTGDECWFNQAMLWHVSNLGRRGGALLELLGPQGVPTNAFFDEDEPIDVALLDHVRRFTWDESVRFDWQRGDVAVVDNYTMAHGRTAYTGERLILLAFGEA